MTSRWGTFGALIVVLALAGTNGAKSQRMGAEEGVASYVVTGDTIAAPLASGPADPERGRQIAIDRRLGNCLICHRVPEPGERFQGDLGPDLAGVGKRLTPGQLRLRLVDQSSLNAATVMPPYYRVDGLRLVDAAYMGRPVLTASQIEDVVAYLASFKD